MAVIYKAVDVAPNGSTQQQHYSTPGADDPKFPRVGHVVIYYDSRYCPPGIISLIASMGTWMQLH